MTGEPLVVCAGLARTYGSGSNAVVAVHGASATVRRGDRIAVSGPSGSGKSTLLHLMAGRDTPTAGTVTRSTGAACRPGDVGVVFQGPSLLTELTARENVALPMLLAGVDEGDAGRRADAALSALAIGNLGDRLPAEISAGQAQRVAVARVLAAEPLLVLADEPTGQLDRATADQVVTVLLEAADLLDAALVIATHDESVAARMTTRWRMLDGRLRVVASNDRRPVARTTP
ncbi:ABC transporter ATP-binding protein [Pseudonocardia sp. DLS-67]